MSDAFLWVMLGIGLGSLLSAYTSKLYRDILVHCAETGNAEKINGNWYFIVPADKYDDFYNRGQR